MKNYIIFVNGTYRTEHLAFYRRLCRSRVKVAADGGMKFFAKARLAPDILIGDLDSLPAATRPLVKQSQVISFPARKNKTDLQLALEYCLESRAAGIDIVVPNCGRPDHFMGNVMLVHLVDRLRRRSSLPLIRFLDQRHEITFVHDGQVRFVGRSGEIVSVIPLSHRIRLTCRGTEFDVSNTSIRRGDTRGISNRICAHRAVFKVEGNALVVCCRRR
ncbi:MAG: thiamine diphosphokinase [bacterium]